MQDAMNWSVVVSYRCVVDNDIQYFTTDGRAESHMAYREHSSWTVPHTFCDTSFLSFPRKTASRKYTWHKLVYEKSTKFSAGYESWYDESYTFNLLKLTIRDLKRL